MTAMNKNTDLTHSLGDRLGFIATDVAVMADLMEMAGLVAGEMCVEKMRDTELIADRDRLIALAVAGERALRALADDIGKLEVEATGRTHEAA